VNTPSSFIYDRVLEFVRKIANYDPTMCPDHGSFAADIKEARELLKVIEVPPEEIDEKYYICERCGDLATETEILDSCGEGGMGLCGCEYCLMMWDEKYDKFEPSYLKYYTPWTKIPKKVYEELLPEKNTVIRLEMFKSVPISVREEC
jgi:hypothetical protein